MNQQRKTIYGLRRQVLGRGAGVPLVEYDEDPKTKKKTRSEKVFTWPDPEHALDLVEDLVLDMVGRAARTPHRLGPRRPRREVKEQFGVDMTFADLPARPRTRPPGRGADLRGRREGYRPKEEEFGDADGVPLLRRYEQYLYLPGHRPALWKDHLLAMDHLRQGIGLRGYGQKDPKQEYKKEGYEMFSRMTWNVNAASWGTCCASCRPGRRRRRRLSRSAWRSAASRRSSRATPARTASPRRRRPETVTRGQPKVGRNDPCPCGSGKKYKKCHGASEAAA